MAGKRKKTTTVVEELPPNLDSEDSSQPTDFDVSLESVEDAEALQDVLSQFGETNLNLKIFRQTSSGTPDFCFQSDVLDEEFIQKNFGGGTYLIRVFINSKYRKTIKVGIANRIHAATSPLGEPNAGVAPDRHSEFLEKLCLALISRENSSSSSVNAAPSLADMTQALKNIDELRGKQESAMDLFLKGVEFAQGATGQTDWKTDLIRTAKDVLPHITDTIAGMRAGSSTGTSPSSTTQTQEISMPPEQMIKAGIQYLKKKAIAGVDPELIIEWVVTNAEEYQGLLAVILNQEFSDIAKFDPEIAVEPFLGWFTQLFNGLRSAFKSEDSMDNHSGGTMGNTSHPGNHGESGKTSESESKVSEFRKPGV